MEEVIRVLLPLIGYAAGALSVWGWQKATKEYQSKSIDELKTRLDKHDERMDKLSSDVSRIKGKLFNGG